MIDDVATEVVALLGTGRQIAPFSTRFPDFCLSDAYRIAAKVRGLRVARGETVVGRKIGFTNRTVWSGYGLTGPIWGYLYDSTVHALSEVGESYSLDGLSEPRIEPEVVLHLAREPRLGTSDEELLACVDWVAQGFEIVYSIFPGWVFTAADAVAAFGVHAGLLIGKPRPISENGRAWAQMLSSFSIELMQDNMIKARGQGRDVLGGPLDALRFLLREIEEYPGTEPIRAGEIITTGTLTQAMPAQAGTTWTTAVDGIDLEGIRVRFRTNG
ncbi:MAG TPA: hydratase [Bauldia sp.]|nr:hydratase [Bauldia sp.]